VQIIDIPARYPTKESVSQLLTQWLLAAKQDGLAKRFPDYVKALERAMVMISKAPSPQHAMEMLQVR
jgi:hypothetical protein